MTEPELAYTVDARTLHEVYPDPDVVAARISALRGEIHSAPDEIAELVARGELVSLLRAGEALDEALDEARAAVDRAEVVGTTAQQHVARVRLAQVFARRGDYAEANLEYTELLAAARRFGPVIDAFTHQGAGTNAYDQGHWDDAAEHFGAALRIREELELDDGGRAESRAGLEAARRAGGGPAQDES